MIREIAEIIRKGRQFKDDIVTDSDIAKKILQLLRSSVREYENKYPMTGKPDKDAAYKNGWYDCAYYIRTEILERSDR